jgi:hypothetical protein
MAKAGDGPHRPSELSQKISLNYYIAWSGPTPKAQNSGDEITESKSRNNTRE